MADLFSLPPPRRRRAAAGRCCAPPWARRSPRRLPIPTVIEVMVNPDGSLRLDRLRRAAATPASASAAAEAERIIRLVAAHVRREVHDRRRSCRPSCPRPASGSRACCRRSSPAPCFAIRKPADALYRLADYVAARIMTARQAEALAQAVRERHNILVAGGTSSGKTTLANALLAEIAALDERVVILEDTRELQVRGGRLRRAAHQAGRRLAGRSGALDPAAATRPHHRRRGARAGSPRHAQGLEHRPSRRHRHRPRQLGARPASTRLEQLVQEAVVTVPRDLIAEAIDSSSSSTAAAARRRVETLAEVDRSRCRRRLRARSPRHAPTCTPFD